jgi:hypothetical protein
MASNDIALSIFTDAKRRPLKINNETYYLADPAELSIAQQVELSRIGSVFERLQNEPDDAALIEAGSALDRAVRYATIGIPESVFESLTDYHKLRIVEVFVEGFNTGQDAQTSPAPAPNSTALPASAGSTTQTRNQF